MEVILTNMCMVYNDQGEILVLNRVENDWPGITFPGGHVEANETHEESVIREVKEETNLDISNVEACGFLEWNSSPREICLLYRTKDYKGTLRSSQEGEVFFIKKEDLDPTKFSLDFDKVLSICLK